MPNTITNTRQIAGTRNIVQYLTIVSDGSEETDYLVYDSSAVATVIGISDPLDSTIKKVYASLSAASTARARLEFDADTDILALDIPAGQIIDKDFREIGGLENTAGTGITGDITLTTTGLESGDLITIILEVIPN